MCSGGNDGSYHTVDPSDAAFQTAGRLAMSEGMPGCAPVLLEPVMRGAVHVPCEATRQGQWRWSGGARRAAGLRRAGRLARLGHGALRDAACRKCRTLIVDLRSLTQGADL